MLLTKNLRLMQLKKKFRARFISLFKVKERQGLQAYELALSLRISGVYLVFYVSLLEPYY